MQKPTRFYLLVLGVSLGGLAALLWLRRDGDGPVTAAAPMIAHAPPIPADEPAALPDLAAETLSPEARSLLAALQRLLASRDRRAREGVLTFKDDAALQRFLERAGDAGLSVLGRMDALRTVRVRYDDLRAFRDELLAHAGDYADVSGNSLVHLPRPPAKQDRAELDLVPFGNRTLEFLGATGDRSQWGRGVTIAVLDTGVAPDATFGNGRLRVLDIGLGASPGAGSGDGHGTGVAALAAGASRDAAGVAPAANLLSVRVTDANGTSDIFTLAQAIVAATDAGAQVINVSMGGYSTNATLEGALGYASARGALVVAAAGNDQAAQLAWPAASGHVLSVGAVDAAEQQVTFSNSGPQLQLTAPGYGVQTAWLSGQRVQVNGTSASSPLVAGAVAAMMSQNSALTPQQAAELLVQAASDNGVEGADPAYGHGMLNLGWAMNRANPAYVDTAIASHTYDEAANEMQFLVQNRSGRPMSGLTLNVTVDNAPSQQSVPTLAPGETHVARVPAGSNAGNHTFSTQLVNPAGMLDQVPNNNRRSSTLTVPAKK